VRLECNLCHSVPVVSGPNQINALLELNRGFEPESHKNSNWINLHRTVFDDSCQGCHTIEDAGGTSNQSFCSNSACHGASYKFAGFDAPRLREIMAEQAAALATPTPEAPSEDPEGGVSPTIATPTTAADTPAGTVTWNTIAPVFKARCSSCHGSNGMKGVDLSTYQSTMAGGTDGAIILPGDADGSILIKVQSGTQKHFGQLSPTELETVRQWIEAGAVEK
jgi:mono/diheme cytochrome c family protein